MYEWFMDLFCNKGLTDLVFNGKKYRIIGLSNDNISLKEVLNKRNLNLDILQNQLNNNCNSN